MKLLIFLDAGQHGAALVTTFGLLTLLLLQSSPYHFIEYVALLLHNGILLGLVRPHRKARLGLPKNRLGLITNIYALTHAPKSTPEYLLDLLCGEKVLIYISR